MHLQSFVGHNYFEKNTAAELTGVAESLRLTINLKVEGDTIEGTDIAFPDFKDIDVDDNRLTVTISAAGKILSVKRG